ncbi:methyltransferase, FxLD system [Kitasatospora sp. NA04385]|uniref:methyltransferase, FxLD system n=1 Tax=Kitasatospora sp. NA04385 TaxID=2742135 RepID=UPI001590C75D|nr:methyltransferase, FxLD system [Kitasatospora sp. NA04385]QKW22277.1 methyltransferase, FxLD system [Kitasatospora sp. NA04385]
MPTLSEIVGPGAHRADALRLEMVVALRKLGTVRSDAVAKAVLTVPRHVFAPESSLAEVYEPERALVTKRNEHGLAVSSVSAARIQAQMLEQADVRPGMRVLEVGSGGYNAALLAELVGPEGEVVTVDIDPFVTERAQKYLAEAGYGRVRVVLADGSEQVEGGPFDRIVVTVGAWDLPPAWTGALVEGGTITVPLRMRGLTRSITFRREGERLVSVSAEVCGFVKIQGADAHDEFLVLPRGTKEIGLRFDELERPDTSRLGGALETPRAEWWTRVTVGNREPFDSLYLWLASSLPGFGLMSVDPELDTKMVAPANRMACPVIVEGGSLAYLALRKITDEPTTFEFGAHGFGPEGGPLAALINTEVRTWDREHRGGDGPVFTAYPAGTPDDRLPDGLVIDKTHVRLTISWP